VKILGIFGALPIELVIGADTGTLNDVSGAMGVGKRRWSVQSLIGEQSAQRFQKT
jgi:hypothetical protein